MASRTICSGSKVAWGEGLLVLDDVYDVFLTLSGHTSSSEDRVQPAVEGVLRHPPPAWGSRGAQRARQEARTEQPGAEVRTMRGGGPQAIRSCGEPWCWESMPAGCGGASQVQTSREAQQLQSVV